MKCENYRDLRTLMIKSEVEPIKRQISKEEYQKLWVSTEPKAKELWQKLIDKNKKFYDKDGYLDIEYLSDKNIYRRKPLGRGRPKQQETKDKRITIRLDSELEEILKNYCQTHNVSESEAIRRAVKNLKHKSYF